ncbi:MAG TPA: M4 family metallopeptidase [Polyangiaceae bacterium]|nr:M4 family metallopeptidase [Polyangiaceae bacterium]
MKRCSLTLRALGVLGLAALTAACSGGSADAPPFADDDSLEAQLLREYGAPFVVERSGANALIVSPLSDTRVVAKDPAGAESAARELFTRHASAFGAGTAAASLRAVRVEADQVDGAISVRLAQVLPGTDIEIEGRGVATDLFADGTLANAAGSLVDTSGPMPTARSTAADAERAIRALVATWDAPTDGDAALAFVDGPRLLAQVSEGGAITLRWRAQFSVGFTGFEAWLSADTAEVLDVRHPTLGVDGEALLTRAWSFHSYPMARALGTDATKLPIGITRDEDGQYQLLRQGSSTSTRILTIEQTGAGTSSGWPAWAPVRSPTSDEFLGLFPVSISGAGATYTAAVGVDVHYNAMVIDRTYRQLVGEGPARGGQMTGLLHANDAYVMHGATRRLVVDGARINPSYDPIVNLVRFGDGDLARGVRPTGLPLDVAGHEWTHAYVARKTGLGTTGGQGALNEVLGDALGKLIAMRLGDSPNGLGAGLSINGAFVRDFADPTRSKARMSEGVTAMPAHFNGLDVGCAQDAGANSVNVVDEGCVHFNAGPGDHAFYLMLKGGKAKSSPVEVRALSRAIVERVWFASASRALPLRTANPLGVMELFAIQQVDLARRHGPAAVASVGCAWLGVGAITEAQLRARDVVCSGDGTERLAPSDCHGRADGYYCSELVPESATLCRGGQIAGGHQCPGEGVCASIDASRAARLDASGAPECAAKTP